MRDCRPVYSARRLVRFDRRGWDKSVLQNMQVDFHGGLGGGTRKNL